MITLNGKSPMNFKIQGSAEASNVHPLNKRIRIKLTAQHKKKSKMTAFW